MSQEPIGMAHAAGSQMEGTAIEHLRQHLREPLAKGCGRIAYEDKKIGRGAAQRAGQKRSQVAMGIENIVQVAEQARGERSLGSRASIDQSQRHAQFANLRCKRSHRAQRPIRGRVRDEDQRRSGMRKSLDARRCDPPHQLPSSAPQGDESPVPILVWFKRAPRPPKLGRKTRRQARIAGSGKGGRPGDSGQALPQRVHPLRKIAGQGMRASNMPPKATPRSALASRDDEANPGFGEGSGEGRHEPVVAVADLSRTKIFAKSRGDARRNDPIVDQDFHDLTLIGLLGVPAPALQHPVVAQFGVSVDDLV